MSRPFVPQPILDAAHARAAARAARDWAAADRLRAEIAAAGWRVIDTGVDFRLEPAAPPEVELRGSIRFGRSGAVPSRLGEPAVGRATIVVPAGEDAGDLRRTLASLGAHEPGLPLVVVADDPPAAVDDALGAAAESPESSLDVVRTSGRLGAGASLAIGIRRATGPIIVVIDPSIEVTGEVVVPLARALDDPAIAVAGPYGLTSGDLRHFTEVATDGPAAAIEGYLLAFRRADAAASGPIDEGFRFYRNLDIWWSLVLRDTGLGSPPRSARVVGGLPLVRHEHRGWTSLDPAERDRLSKRNFYRLLDRFRGRDDLAVERAG